jgi:UPF0271 protein
MPSSPDRVIDLNADVGEGPGEEPLYALVTSANIACTGHAGDDDTMRDAVRSALRHGVAIGAHPSYPDRERFGRVTMSLAPASLTQAVAAQVAALVRIAAEVGGRVTHVKPHGALYSDAATRPDVARAVAAGVASVSPALSLVGLAGSEALHVWSEMGFHVSAEGFADRTYTEDGNLVPRTRAGAVITDPAAASSQAIRLASDGCCDTICVHGDTAGAVTLARAVRRGLEGAGFVVSALARQPRGK